MRSPFFIFRACPGARAVILERRKTKDLSRLAVARFANRAQRVAGVRGEVGILLTGDEEIASLNQQFRNKAKPTDVLSFPALQAQAGAKQPTRLRVLGGDIAISLETARTQAADYGHPLLTEVKVLILHGMLHLAGYDHESDNGRMERLERRLRAELHLPAGLIERNGNGIRKRRS